MACIIKESTLDFLDLIPTFDLLREKVNAQTEQMKKISDFISTVENAPNKEELKKALNFFELNAAAILNIISGLEEKHDKPKNPVNKTERLQQVIKQLKASLVVPNVSRGGNVDYSQPDEIVTQIKDHQKEIVMKIHDLSKSINKDKSGILKKVRLLGKCSGLLRNCARKEKTTFREALLKCRDKYSPDYASFLIRLSTLLDDYPRLLQSAQSLHWFRANMRYIEEICMENMSEWDEVPEQYSDDEMY